MNIKSLDHSFWRMNGQPDYYQILEVPYSAAQVEIDVAYYAAALQAHLERGGTYEICFRRRFTVSE